MVSICLTKIGNGCINIMIFILGNGGFFSFRETADHAKFVAVSFFVFTTVPVRTQTKIFYLGFLF